MPLEAMAERRGKQARTDSAEKEGSGMCKDQTVTRKIRESRVGPREQELGATARAGVRARRRTARMQEELPSQARTHWPRQRQTRGRSSRTEMEKGKQEKAE